MTSPAQLLLNMPLPQGTWGLGTEPADQLVVISVDTLVAGVHFPLHTLPRDIGHKVLAVNLSDLAAMGADPSWATLSLTIMLDEPAWLDEFADGFLSLARRFGVRLLATETSRGPLSFTVEVGGLVPRGKPLRRDKARPGDLIFVTGTLGDAGVALAAMQGRLSLHEHILRDLSVRLNRPEPRVQEGLALRTLASSAIDISDGLAADLGHILERSGAGAELEMDRLPLSPSLLSVLEKEQAWRAALNSGDDYELCFTLPPDRQEALAQAWQSMRCPITAIGRVVTRPGLSCRRHDGTEFTVGRGYEHFT